MAIDHKVLIGIGLLTGLVLLIPKRRSKPSGGVDPSTSDSGPMSEDREGLRFYLIEAGLSDDWIAFFEAVAANESGFNNLVGLGNSSLFPSFAQPNTKASIFAQEREYQAAVIAYERNADRFQECGYPVSEYTFGSGGWFGMLPSNALAAFFGTPYQCLRPGFVFSPGGSVVMAVEMARRLMRWDSWESTPTFANLRVGWGNPASMGQPSKITAMKAKLEDRLIEVGANPGLASAQPSPLPPSNPVGLFDYLVSL